MVANNYGKHGNQLAGAKRNFKTIRNGPKTGDIKTCDVLMGKTFEGQAFRNHALEARTSVVEAS